MKRIQVFLLATWLVVLLAAGIVRSQPSGTAIDVTGSFREGTLVVKWYDDGNPIYKGYRIEYGFARGFEAKPSDFASVQVPAGTKKQVEIPVEGEYDFALVRVHLLGADGKELARSNEEMIRLSSPSLSSSTLGQLNLTLNSFSSSNFPFLYSQVTVDTSGVAVVNLPESAFRAFENGVLQTDFFQVTPPATGGGVRIADIIFVMDNSGSMDDIQAAVVNNVRQFVDSLVSRGIDMRLGLVRFGQYDNGQYGYSGSPIVEDNGVTTSDVNYFKNTVLARNVSDGWFEPGFHALVAAAQRFSFRPGAQKTFILTTDEDNDIGPSPYNYTLSQTVSVLTSAPAIVYGLVDQFWGTSYTDYVGPGSVTQATGGRAFQIRQDQVTTMLNYINFQAAAQYTVRYRSSDPVFNGTTRLVKIIVNAFGQADTVETSYVPGAAPIIQRTPATIALHNQPWAEGTTFTIEADITDNVPPLVQSARLYYRRTGVATYSSVAMTRQTGDRYRGIIPGSAVQTPGLDYYITATDGQTTSSDPRTDPANNPYQFGILPNVAPVITHTPVTTLTPGNPITITANIVDNTNSLSAARLYYRKTGQLLYQQATMTSTGGNNYQAMIPASYVTIDGVDYYIYAVDNFGVSSTHGTSDNPHYIESRPVFLQYLSTKDFLISRILGIERPFWGTSSPFYGQAETNARSFVARVRSDSLAGNADTLDAEGVARLVLSERVTHQALVDAIDISLYGAKGAKSIAFAWVVEGALSHLAQVVRADPVVGELAANLLDDLATRVENTIYSLNLAFQNGLRMPSGQLTLPQWSAAMDATRNGLSESAIRIVRTTAQEIDRGVFDGGLFETADHIIQDFLYLSALELQTTDAQLDAVQRAQNHLFPRNSFTPAAADATRTLNNMTGANQIAKDLGNFVNTIRELTDIAVLIAAIVLVIIGIIGAIPTGGTSLLAAIVGIATFLVTWGSFVSQVAAITEAAGSAVYVNGILPHVYLNPSVDDAFGNGTGVGSYQQGRYVLASQRGQYGTASQTGTEAMLAYYSRLREMIRTANPQWATIGIDSLKYYERQYKDYELINTVRFAAAADTASRVVASYTPVANSYFTKIAARELFTAAIEASAFAYRYGLQIQGTLNTALSAIDSTVLVARKVDTASTILSAMISQANIPVQPAVGIGNVKLSLLSKGQRKAKVEAEVINFSGVGVSNVQSIVTTPNGVVIGDSIVTLALSGNGRATIAFQLGTQDSILAGAVLIRHSPSFYSLPGKLFSFNFSAASPDNIGSVGEGHSYAYPNPFNPETDQANFRFKLGKDGNVTITLYDISNTKVNEVISGVPMSGGVEQSVAWDGRNERGDIVGNGVYFYIIESSSGERAVGKIAVLR